MNVITKKVTSWAAIHRGPDVHPGVYGMTVPFPASSPRRLIVATAIMVAPARCFTAFSAANDLL